MDWIDKVRDERSVGLNKPLYQSEHHAVNSRYPGLTIEYCIECGEPTGNAGKGEDSNYTENDEGPFCWGCFPEKEV